SAPAVTSERPLTRSSSLWRPGLRAAFFIRVSREKGTAGCSRGTRPFSSRDVGALNATPRYRRTDARRSTPLTMAQQTQRAIALKLHFLGAAGEVTGSSYLIDTGACRFLID